jgi:hypothetical protein
MIRFLLYYCLLSLLLTQCAKPEEPAVTEPDPVDTTNTTPVDPDPSIIALGKGAFKKNGINWPGKFEAWLADSNQSVKIITEFKWANQLKETFALYDVPTKVGKYEFEYNLFTNAFNQIPQAYWLISEIDLGIGDYRLDTDIWASHYVEVLRYDSTTHIIEGKFNLLFRNYSQGPVYPGEPDSVVITEGKFHLKAEKL